MDKISMIQSALRKSLRLGCTKVKFDPNDLVNITGILQDAGLKKPFFKSAHNFIQKTLLENPHAYTSCSDYIQIRTYLTPEMIWNSHGKIIQKSDITGISFVLYPPAMKFFRNILEGIEPRDKIDILANFHKNKKAQLDYEKIGISLAICVLELCRKNRVKKLSKQLHYAGDFVKFRKEFFYIMMFLMTRACHGRFSEELRNNSFYFMHDYTYERVYNFPHNILDITISEDELNQRYAAYGSTDDFRLEFMANLNGRIGPIEQLSFLQYLVQIKELIENFVVKIELKVNSNQL